MKRTYLTMVVALTALAANAINAPTVVMSQDAATGEITVTYTLAESATFVPTLQFQTKGEGDAWVDMDDRVVSGVTGDVNRKMTASGGTIKCMPAADSAADMGNVRAKVTLWPMDDTPDYMVVSLTHGAKDADSRIHYYTSTNALPGGLLENVEYRTTSMVFRKVRAKGVTWRMGSNVNAEPSAKGFTDEASHEVTLDRNYYLAVFPLTQSQYATLQDAKNSGYFPLEPALRAQDSLYFSRTSPGAEDARGANYPDPPHGNSILGRMRALFGGAVDFDLPSEAEWEFACRAGYGDNYFGNGAQMVMTAASRDTDAELDKLGRYKGNNATPWFADWTSARDYGKYMGVTNGTPNVGSYAPNAWGFYDMLGGVNEWCLDWYQADITKYGGAVNVNESDPTKSIDGTTCTQRAVRGSNYHCVAFECRPAHRYYKYDQGYRGDVNDNGMRVKCYMGLRK